VALGQTLEGLNGKLQEQAREIATIPGLVGQLQQVRTELESARWEVQDRDRQLADAARAMTEVYASRSWRITRPLRWLSEKLRQS
jgi:hypothetical protein